MTVYACPDCGSPLVERHPKPHQTWSMFYGCGAYPKCSFSLTKEELKEEIDCLDVYVSEAYTKTLALDKELDREKVFKKELSYINNDRIHDIVLDIISLMPDYFFTIPASSTGKYHPKYALGDGGLVRHTKAAVSIARDLFTVTSLWWGELNQEEKDFVIGALIVHDGWKSGVIQSKYTLHEHPEIARDVIEDIDFKSSDDKMVAGTIADLVRSHMGQWNTHSKSDIALLLPITKLQKFVHLCDYLASRKTLEVIPEVFA